MRARPHPRARTHAPLQWARLLALLLLRLLRRWHLLRLLRLLWLLLLWLSSLLLLVGVSLQRHARKAEGALNILFLSL